MWLPVLPRKGAAVSAMDPRMLLSQGKNNYTLGPAPCGCSLYPSLALPVVGIPGHWGLSLLLSPFCIWYWGHQFKGSCSLPRPLSLLVVGRCHTSSSTMARRSVSVCLFFGGNTVSANTGAWTFMSRLLVLGHTWWCAGLTPGSALRDHSCWGLRDHINARA